MISIPTLFLLLFALETTCMQTQVPIVERVVTNVLSTSDEYVHFNGNNTNSPAHIKRQSSSYWYENINHQGISAFGSSGYQVFRNVRDYGAKGT